MFLNWLTRRLRRNARLINFSNSQFYLNENCIITKSQLRNYNQVHELKKKENDSKMMQKNKIKENLKKYKTERKVSYFNASLASYISVCMNNKQYNTAIETFWYHAYNSKGSEEKINSIDVYNEILKGLAKQGMVSEMLKVVNLLRSSKIQPNVNTFCYIFNCFGRDDVTPNRVPTSEVVEWMKEENISLNSFFSSAIFPVGSLDLCIRALRKVIQAPESHMPTTDNFHHACRYSSKLLHSLDHLSFSNRKEQKGEGGISQNISKMIAAEYNQERRISIVTPRIENKLNSSIEFDLLLNAWKETWRADLQKSFSHKREMMRNNYLIATTKPLSIFPYLFSLKDEEFIDLMIKAVENICSGSEVVSPSRQILAYDLGEAVYQRYVLHYKEENGILKKLLEIYEKYCSSIFGSKNDSSYIHRVEWERLLIENKVFSTLKFEPPQWPREIKLAIGKILYSIMISTMMICKPKGKERQLIPALYRISRTHSYATRFEIKPAPFLMKAYQRTMKEGLSFEPSLMPMLSPPLPWTEVSFGGYLVHPSHFIRTVRYPQQQNKALKDCNRSDLYPIFDCLNQISSVPWKINKPMLELITEIFVGDGWPEMDIPTTLEPQKPNMVYPMMPYEKYQFHLKLAEINKKKREMYSLWCAALYKISIANCYKDKVFWLPHNLDFRGRIYPIPPHLNHMSADIFRSLLLFAQGKRLGAEGLNWLKLHLVNLTGVKKRCSISERFDYCDEIHDEILDSAKNPLNGRKFWVTIDEPWQFLATCKEYAAVMQSPCPEDYISYLPVHQDGSCNGLQHYAALGRDQSGAESVNLAPSSVPQDVYSNVVALVEETREKDAESGNHIAQILEGCVKRKVIKQTIMTTVYGVTKFGALHQIKRQLEDLDFPKKDLVQASSYLASKTFESLGDIFSSTKLIQNWLINCALCITKVKRKNVAWVSPLGFPVVQYYSKPVDNSAINYIYNLSVDQHLADVMIKPDPMKQKNGFPPNYIHSLDASHMMLTSLFCQEMGITFVSVHDCFWTHASTVPIMNKACREQFVSLHSQDLLEDLSKYLLNYLKENEKEQLPKEVVKVIEDVPKLGNFELPKVLQSIFFFS